MEVDALAPDGSAPARADGRDKLLNAFNNLGSLGAQLSEIAEAKTAVNDLGISDHLSDLRALAKTAQLEVERGNVTAALSAALGSSDVQHWLAPQLQGKGTKKVLGAFKQLGTTVRQAQAAPGPVTGLLIRQEQLNLDLKDAGQRAAVFDDLLSLLVEQDKAYRVELMELDQAHRWLRSLKERTTCLAPKASSNDQGDGAGGKKDVTDEVETWDLTELFDSEPDKKCREWVFRLLVHYSAAWTLGRVEVELIDQRMIGLHQQAALDRSDIALAKWQSLLELPAGQLVSLYETGVKPQDILEILDLVGLGWIAGGVN